ncbi:MAG: AMP-binding protein [Actinobacteria bacterium]|nr:AMP-binding protein [Actinomycetota bacterium]
MLKRKDRSDESIESVGNLSDFFKDSLNDRKRFFFYKHKYRVWKWSFRDIYLRASKFAVFLTKTGISKNDKVLIKGTNRPEWIIAFIGCFYAGAVVVPLNAQSGIDFDLKVQKKVGAKIIITGIENGTDYKIPDIKKIYFEDFEESIFGLPLYDRTINAFNNNDLIEVVFTSGTTSEPKGVMITYGNIISSLNAVLPVMKKWMKIFNLMINPKILSLVPLGHMYGQLIGIFTPLMINSSVVFTDNLNPQNILKVIREEKIWILSLLPKLLEILKDYVILKFGLNSENFKKIYEKIKSRRWQERLWVFKRIHFAIGWRFVSIMVGGAALDSSVEEFWRCLAYSIFQGYGLTETSPLITLADPSTSTPGSIGRVLQGEEVKLINNEIYVKGPNVSIGYFGDETKTKQSFSNGWFKTGDLAEIDGSGNIFFKGRADDVIIRADGINIYPEDIEKVLKSIEPVKDCAVVGIKYDGRDEIYAVLLLKENASYHPGKIIESANSKLNIYQKIDGFFVWDQEDFPRTPTMKIKKSEILRFVNEKIKMPGNENRRIKTSGQKPLSKIYSILNSFHGLKKELKPEDKLENDLGLDSLDMVQLSTSIEEKFNFEIDDVYITRDTTIKDLENLVTMPQKENRKLPFYSFPYWFVVRIIRAAFQYLIYPFISVLYRLKVYGRENLKNLKLPVVFASNHTSNLDTFVLLYSMPLKIRIRVVALMSIEYHFQNFFYHKGNWFRRMIEAIGFYLLVNLAINAAPLSRTYGFNQVLKNTGKLIDRNWSILIFPEGGVTIDGKIKKFEAGIGIIAEDMRVPVVPVKIDGLYNILHNGILPLGHKPVWPEVNVTFGRPVEFKGKSYNDVAFELENIIKNMQPAGKV